ncbi:MAG: sugar isomerase domain-containing protein, partial [bacterium]|nr:sugar isomerase domain-containing protein [bacterium]
VFLERVEGYGKEIMKSYNFDPRDSMWLFSHSGINNVNIDIALEAKQIGMKVIVLGSAAAFKDKSTRHSSGKKIFEIADVVVDTCVPAEDAVVPLQNHQDKIAPISTMAFVTAVWMIIATVAERLVEKGIKLYIHPSHNVPGDSTARERLTSALSEYKRRIAGV